MSGNFFSISKENKNLNKNISTFFENLDLMEYKLA
jgi:hypothetical protein